MKEMGLNGFQSLIYFAFTANLSPNMLWQRQCLIFFLTTCNPGRVPIFLLILRKLAAGCLYNHCLNLYPPEISHYYRTFVCLFITFKNYPSPLESDSRLYISRHKNMKAINKYYRRPFKNKQ